MRHCSKRANPSRRKLLETTLPGGEAVPKWAPRARRLSDESSVRGSLQVFWLLSGKSDPSNDPGGGVKRRATAGGDSGGPRPWALLSLQRWGLLRGGISGEKIGYVSSGGYEGP